MAPGVAIGQDEIEALLEQHKPLILFICHGVPPAARSGVSGVGCRVWVRCQGPVRCTARRP